ncbi:polysaccharide biosynthesis tyrosine autokinase [Arthrobacter sp. zg-Y1219]|uniref:polysaccharide biosynthesis tyrosine autokinase n=1 Tax=Arthrobacter sp. zg-Y1219 TaxID=3049067 RepID=UPI0024C4448E|nr:polysaccharide biosynthesis tyrosine autokinase [Arthrobacter sp. zg-Y1219]MDK1360184.1 polysaccharide biosynthesis tyrosine autokinase [Arthrobacter sp. zg-Y1219]
MEISDYLRALRRSWISAVCCVLLGLLTAGLFATLSAPAYTSKTQLFVSIQNSGSVQELQQGNNFSQARVKSYIQTVRTPAVLQPVVDALALDMTPEALAKNVIASADLDTVLITISFTDESPVQAAAVANAIADSLIATIETLERPAEGGVSPVKLSVVTPANAPAFPSAPNTRLYLAIGFLGGVAAAFVFVALRTALDTRVRGEADLLRVTQAAILGGLAFDPDAVKTPLITHTSPQSARAESFRQIRTNLQFANVSQESSAVLITSSLPGEGKSTTATNLAIALAQAGQSVCLVDADLRRPRVHEYLGLERNAGLTTALIGSAEVKDVLQPWGEDNLHVLTSGQIPPNPSELLGSRAMKLLLSQLEDQFDAVIIDAPPLLPVTDASVLAQVVGGVILVVGSSKVRVQDVQKAMSSLSMVEARLLGTVFNLLPTKGPDAYAYADYTYESVVDVAAKSRPRNVRSKTLKNNRNTKSVLRREHIESNY